MHTIVGSFATEDDAAKAAFELEERGVPVASVQLMTKAACAAGNQSLFDETPALLAVNVASGEVAQEMVESVLHHHHAARVHGLSGPMPPLADLVHPTPPSTGTYEAHSPVGGGQHSIDVVTEVLPPG
jgi:hypothetical protein